MTNRIWRWWRRPVILVVQSFEKVPALKALAPTQKEPPFAVVQSIILALFVVATVFAIKRFHPAAEVARNSTDASTQKRAA